MRKIHDEQAHRSSVYADALAKVASLRDAGHVVAFYGNREPTRVLLGSGEPSARVRIIWPTEGTGQVTLRVMTEHLRGGSWVGEHVQGARPLPGDRFGKLVVLGQGPSHGPSKEFKLTCRCDCGEITHTFARHLRSGEKRSCRECERPEPSDGNYCAEYNIWNHMNARCANPNAREFPGYGGRGITVCERWRTSFFSFLSDVGPRPSTKHSIDRIDNNGNYEPANCRWATREEQANNKRTNRFVMLRGERMTIANCARLTGVPYDTLRERIRKGWETERAVSQPIRETRRHG